MFFQAHSLQKKIFGVQSDHPTTACIMFVKGDLMKARKDNRESLKL
jgi:hypothetical protein